MTTPIKDRLKTNIQRERDRLIAARADLYKRLAVVESNLSLLGRFLDAARRKNSPKKNSKKPA